MGIKAATGFEAGVPDYVPGGTPSVPAGYVRYPTNIATADVLSPSSFLFGIAVEDEMTIDIPSYLTVLLVGGYATGFIVVPPLPSMPQPPITEDLYFYYPGNGDYLTVEFTYSIASGGVFFGGGLSLGIGIGLTMMRSNFYGSGPIESFTDEFTDEFT